MLFDIFAGVRIVYWEIWVKGAIKSESVKSVYPLSEAYPHRAEEEIIHEQGDYWNYRHDGELDKGKIHCSCPYCRRKSQDTPKISDIRKREMLEDLP